VPCIEAKRKECKHHGHAFGVGTFLSTSCSTPAFASAPQGHARRRAATRKRAVRLRTVGPPGRASAPPGSWRGATSRAAQTAARPRARRPPPGARRRPGPRRKSPGTTRPATGASPPLRRPRSGARLRATRRRPTPPQMQLQTPCVFSKTIPDSVRLTDTDILGAAAGRRRAPPHRGSHAKAKCFITQPLYNSRASLRWQQCTGWCSSVCTGTSVRRPTWRDYMRREEHPLLGAADDCIPGARRIGVLSPRAPTAAWEIRLDPLNTENPRGVS